MKQRPLGTVCVLLIILQVLVAATGAGKPPSVPADWKDKDNISVLGRVYRTEIRPDYQILYLQDAEVSHQNKKSIQLNLVVYDSEFRNVHLGNLVWIEGTCALLEEPRNPGNYNQKFYYEKQGLSLIGFAERVQVVENDIWEIRDMLQRIRNRWHRMLIEVLGEKNGGMLSAMMTGDKSHLDKEWKEAYQANGIGHLLAISGLHISFIGLGFYQGLRKIGLPYSLAGVLGAVFLILYAIMTGMSVSTARAMVMLLFRIGADLCGRVYDMMTALLIAAALILLDNPFHMRDAGFLLSFGAILGILLILPVLKALFPCHIRIAEGIYASLAIQIMLFPITLYFFFEIPPYAVVLNFFVIPLMSPVLGAGILGSLLYCLIPWVGTWVLKSTGIVFGVYEILCKWCMRLPYSRIVIGQPDWKQVILCYGMLFLFLIWARRIVSEGEWNRRRRIGTCVCLMLFLGISLPWRWKVGNVQVTMLDVGQGDGIYMRGPSGVQYLMDGGSSDVKEVGKYRIEPFLKSQGVGRLDYVFLSHGDEDHISGVREMLVRQETGIRIRTLVLPVEEVWEEALREMAQIARKNGTKVMTIREGEGIEEEGFRVQCLQPGENDGLELGNEASMVLRVEYRDFDFLLTGDVEGKGEELLMEKEGIKEVDVLKAAHHGSKNSTKENFLERVRPKIAWISAGRENSYGHPHPETVRRLETYHAKRYSTQTSGAVTIETDGEKFRIQEYVRKER